MKDKFIDKLHTYSPKGRKNPFEEDSKFLNEINEGINYLESLFYKLKDRTLNVEDTLVSA